MSRKFKSHEQICLTWITILVALAALSCIGHDFGFVQPTPKDLCKCPPIEPDIADYRRLAKHVPIPNIAVQEVSVRDHSYLVTRPGHTSRRATNWART